MYKLINARDELLKHVSSFDKILAADILHVDKQHIPSCLVWHAGQNIQHLTDWLDFEYDGNGYGQQFVFGFVWWKDGSWSGRENYDGEEWWRHYVCPPLPPK